MSGLAVRTAVVSQPVRPNNNASRIPIQNARRESIGRRSCGNRTEKATATCDAMAAPPQPPPDCGSTAGATQRRGRQSRPTLIGSTRGLARSALTFGFATGLFALALILVVFVLRVLLVFIVLRVVVFVVFVAVFFL